ncbi:hypothetical protein Dsin_007658 [Dipteronia sinensis]|uniref:Uncharacterized protein n=1 Tax=Dipteronia sinensis TaxID=43782 RepID=A0AAE0EGS9_9ROSI|nr:hypothetical protein Dsin_007658 [Dipteronia sinensis]
MGRRRKSHSSTPRHEQPGDPPSKPPITDVESLHPVIIQPSDPPSKPPITADESLHPVIIHKVKISRALLFLFKRHHEALGFIQDSVSCYPNWGHLRLVEACIHKHMADHVAKDCVEKIKHLSRGAVSARSAAELLPESLYCAAVHAGLLCQLAEFNDKWDKVNEECLRGLKIENPNDPGIDRFYGKFVMGLRSKESRIADERELIIKILLSLKQPPLDDSKKPCEEKESSIVEKDVKEMQKREKKHNNLKSAMESTEVANTELGDSVNVDKMEKLKTKEGIHDEHLEHKSQIENGDKKKSLEEKNDETDESIGKNGAEGVFDIYSKHINDDEYEKRFQTDIEKALKLENPVDDAEMGVSTSGYESKQRLVTVVRKIAEDLEHERQIRITNKQKELAGHNAIAETDELVVY